MISLLNFIDTGFIITLGILILVCGAVMLYCYRRLNLLENSVIEHGKILQSFIANYNNQLLMNHMNNNIGTNNNHEMHTQEESQEENNLETGTKTVNMDQESNKDKICVSDESDDSDSEDEDEGSEDEEDGSDDSDEEEGSDAISDLEEERVEEIKSIQIDKNEENAVEEEVLVEELSNVEETVKDENEDFLNNVPIDMKDLDIMNLSTMALKSDSKIINLGDDLNENDDDNDNDNDNVSSTGDKKSYNKMKVDELRALIVTKNLLDNEAASKLKKQELLKLLQTQ